ncbi:MAG: GNAT family N-acetyltransferase [Acidimicrobiales bacterium]|jgi:ribosomal protein S18 acetylase RimI-like enzyme
MDPEAIEIIEVTAASDEVVEALRQLVPQLSSSSPPPTLEQVQEMVSSPATVLFIARDAGRVVGTLTLALFRIPTGFRAWIEDVIVDTNVRGRGVGAVLVAAAIERANLMGAKTVDLTSRPSREAANRLYLRMGFDLRETNVYRHQAG